MEEQITVLSNKEKARERINVFHDSSLNWINLIKELLGNSIDIFNDDKSIIHHIFIQLITNKKVCYQDDGTGIPVDGIASDGSKNYEAIFEKDFAGSRYGNKGKTVGQNGLFLWTLAMSSEDLEVEVGRPDGNIYLLKYHKGDRVGNIEVVGKTDKTYSKLTFSPDEDIWTLPNYTFEEVSQICEGQSSMSNVIINLKDSFGNENTYNYGNITNYFNEKTQNKSFVCDNIHFISTIDQWVEKEKQKYEMDIELVLRFSNDSEDDFKKDFLNTADLIKHGTIKDGVVNGLKLVFNKYLKDNKLYKDKEKQITNEDIDLGLNYVVSVQSNFAEYVSQSKQSTDNDCYKEALQTFIKQQMESFIAENKSDMDKLAQQILINKRSREKANSTRLNIRKQLSSNIDITNRVKKFVDCRTKDIKKRELYIVEGDSALGSCKLGRNAEFQGIMPVRGKILNCLKADYDKIFKSDVIVDLLKVLGCGVETKSKKNKDLNTFDITLLKWDKIIICTDADVDGYQIRTLILTMLYRLVPTLIEKGKVFIADTPLYEITNKNKTYFAFNDEEKEKLLPSLTGSIDIQRSKGLGENTPDMMWETTMNPDTRHLIQVTLSNVEEEYLNNVKNTFDTLLGDDIDSRRKVIAKEIKNYIEVIDCE